MIKTITMKAGASPGQANLRVDLSAVTIFVGPNNAGKSRALLEIEAAARSGAPHRGVVIEAIEFEAWTAEEIGDAIRTIEAEPSLHEVVQADHVVISKLHAQTNSTHRLHVHKPSILDQAQRPNDGRRHHYAEFLSLFTLKLDGTNRLALTNDQPSGDLQKDAPNHLAHLFVNNKARLELRRMVKDAFGKFLVVDPTNIGQLRLRLADREPANEREEKGWDSVAQSFHAQAHPISEASDGVKAFVGMLATIVAGDPKITLIDEPEAFLHPSLAARLGKELTNAMGSTRRRLLVSTHSASFLMGCIQAGAAVNIIRLTYDYANATARLLPREKLSRLMRNPLLRSIGVLNALFYSAVVVTEGDADRAFYQEINERLLAAGDNRGIGGCLFLNAQNKTTVWDIVGPLRELGIPAVGIVDIDVLKDGGKNWVKLLEGSFIPVISHIGLQAERAALLSAFDATQKDMKRNGGIGLLSSTDQEACRNLFDKLFEYGVFVVPGGELESWLPELGANTSKSRWLVEIFEKMGEEPAAADYVKPRPGDVWDFLGKVHSWVGKPTRKGIPA